MMRLHTAMARLTAAEVSFFKSNGYLIKEGALDPILLAKARSLWWAQNPARPATPGPLNGLFCQDRWRIPAQTK